MILILSTEIGELSTEEVIDWLDRFSHPFERVNGESLNSSDPYNFRIGDGAEKGALKVEGLIKENKYINVVWYRRWNRHTHLDYIKSFTNSRSAVEINLHLNKELASVSNTFFLTLSDKFWLDHPKNVRLSKIETLLAAKSCGLHVPLTIITNSKRTVLDFVRENGRVITKPVVDGGSLFMKDQNYIMYTHEVDTQSAETLPEHFYPSLFQKLIEKKIEIRTFFLDGKCYSMAIFSQTNAQTAVDFRIYDDDKPNRNVPYNLPVNISEGISKLMDKIGLRSGSVDLIVDEDNNYVFLEVNPIGQFGMVSTPCNYNLEKIIAEYLISKDEQLC